MNPSTWRTHVIFAPDDTGAMRIAASVGDVPIYAKFMKPETA